MSAPAATLHGFAYGEHLDGPQQRSLGFRLLAPVESESWSAEVETLARALQGTTYPDQWPPADLFCSVLLADGQRLVAVARYGLADHTPSQRRSGLELIGVVGPGSLGVPSAVALYGWLRQQRAGTSDLRALGGPHSLADVLAVAPPGVPLNDPLPVLPIRLWQEGALLFAANSPSDADRRLGLLEQGTAATWQWLPLVGADFPLQSYAQRGPLVAWTPHLAGIALKLDRKTTNAPLHSLPPRRLASMLAALLLAALLIANLWATLSLPNRLVTHGPSGIPTTSPRTTLPAVANDAARERFAQDLYHLLQKRGVISDGNQSQLLGVYEALMAENEGLRVSSTEGKLAVGAVSLLSRRSPAQVETLVREALADRGYDPALVERACLLVRERLGPTAKSNR